MHEELWQQLCGLDGEENSRRAKCEYVRQAGHYVITLLGSKYIVDAAKKEIYAAGANSGRRSAAFLEQLCILAYLIHSKAVPPSGRLVQAESLAGGEFFFRGPHVLPVGKLKAAFGSRPELLYEAGMRFGAKKCDFGDASVEVQVLPRVALTFIIWAGDDEFDARGSILFDSTAAEQLELDALLAAVNLCVGALVRCVSKDE